MLSRDRAAPSCAGGEEKAARCTPVASCGEGEKLFSRDGLSTCRGGGVSNPVVPKVGKPLQYSKTILFIPLINKISVAIISPLSHPFYFVLSMFYIIGNILVQWYIYVIHK